MVRLLGRQVGASPIFLGAFSTIQPQSWSLQLILQDVLMPPTRCPNTTTGSPVFLQDPVERKRRVLKGGVGLMEGEW